MSFQPIKDFWHWLQCHLAPVPLEEPDPDWVAELAAPAPVPAAALQPWTPSPHAASAPSTAVARRRPGGLIGAIREAETELGIARPALRPPTTAAALRPVPHPRIPQVPHAPRLQVPPLQVPRPPAYRVPQPGPAVPLPVLAARQARDYAGVYTARELPPARPGAELVPVAGYEVLHPDASYGARLAYLWKEHDARITLARGLVYNTGAEHLAAFDTFARKLTAAGAR